MSLNKTEDESSKLDNNNNLDETNENLDETEEKNLDEVKENKKDDSTEKLKEKINYLENQLKISLADFSNYKKRVSKDLENLSFIEKSKIILEFLNFKETLKKAIEHESNEAFKNSLKELDKNFTNILKRLDVKKLELKNKDYDYNLSECIQTLKVNKKEEDNKIIDVLEDGFTYKEKVIKPAKVIIGNFTEE